MRLFKPKNVDLGGPSPPMGLDGLLKRHQRDDCDAPSQVAPEEADESRRRTLAALNSVDERTRQIFLAHRDGYTYAEIAVAWGISYRKIKRCIFRALLTIMEGKTQ